MERFKCPVGVFVLLFDDEGKIIFQNRRPENLYGLVGGHIDGNEKVVDAIIREAKEEIGVDIMPNDLSLATVCHSNANCKEYMQFYFVCKAYEGNPRNLEEDKCSGLASYFIDDTPDNTVPYIKEALNKIMDGITFYETGF